MVRFPVHKDEISCLASLLTVAVGHPIAVPKYFQLLGYNMMTTIPFPISNLLNIYQSRDLR